MILSRRNIHETFSVFGGGSGSFRWPHGSSENLTAPVERLGCAKRLGRSSEWKEKMFLKCSNQDVLFKELKFDTVQDFRSPSDSVEDCCTILSSFATLLKFNVTSLIIQHHENRSKAQSLDLRLLDIQHKLPRKDLQGVVLEASWWNHIWSGSTSEEPLRASKPNLSGHLFHHLWLFWIDQKSRSVTFQEKPCDL